MSAKPQGLRARERSLNLDSPTERRANAVISAQRSAASVTKLGGDAAQRLDAAQAMLRDVREDMARSFVPEPTPAPTPPASSPPFARSRRLTVRGVVSLIGLALAGAAAAFVISDPRLTGEVNTAVLTLVKGIAGRAEQREPAEIGREAEPEMESPLFKAGPAPKAVLPTSARAPPPVMPRPSATAAAALPANPPAPTISLDPETSSQAGRARRPTAVAPRVRQPKDTTWTGKMFGN